MRLGDICKAKVVEVMTDNSLILSFNGKLLRVVNKTGVSHKMDDFVSLQVSKVLPLEFKLLHIKTI